MRRISFLILYLLITTLAFSKNYPFIGRMYIEIADTCYRFTDTEFEKWYYNFDGEWERSAYTYRLKKEGAYLVANVNKDIKMDKLYIFCADKKHLIFYDSDENKIHEASEKIGHRDESWILSCLEYDATSYLSEVINGKKIDYVPENLSISKLTSAWVEGVEGYGKNEKISFKNRQFDTSRRIYIINGFFSPEKPSLFYDNNRIKTLKINCYKDGEIVNSMIKVLKDTGEMQILEFSERYSSFDFIIQDVYKGRKYDDTALTGIFIDALDAYEN